MSADASMMDGGAMGPQGAVPAPPVDGTAPPAGLSRLLPIGCVDPMTIGVHPYAELLPRMTAAQFAELRESIEVDGLQVPVVLFEGRLLDGRNRCRACAELGVPVQAVELIGSDADALTYVFSANQYHRDMTPSQRAAVAALLLPHIAEDVNQKRIEKLRGTLRQKQGGECLMNSSNTQDAAAEPVSAHTIAAHMMRVSRAYVVSACRVQRDAPELFEQVRSGAVSLQEALRRLDGVVDDATAKETRATRTRLNRFLRHPDEHPGFLGRVNALMDEFEGGGR